MRTLKARQTEERRNKERADKLEEIKEISDDASESYQSSILSSIDSQLEYKN